MTESVAVALIGAAVVVINGIFALIARRDAAKLAAKLDATVKLAEVTHAVVTAKLDPTGIIQRAVVTPGEAAPPPPFVDSSEEL